MENIDCAVTALSLLSLEPDDLEETYETINTFIKLSKRFYNSDILQRVTRRFMERGTDNEKERLTIFLIKRGSLPLIEYLTRNKMLYLDDPVSYAAIYNRLDILKYLLDYGYPCTSKAINLAADWGNLKIVKFLHKKGCKWTTDAVDWAAEKGHLDVVKYLIKHGAKCTVDAVNNAAINGYLDVVKYLESKDAPLSFDDYTVVEEVIKNGYYQIAYNLIDYGYMYTNEVEDVLKSKGYIL